MFDAIRQRLEQIQAAGARAMPRAAARIGFKYRTDATTRRGNVPYTPVPIEVTGDANGVKVTGPDWSLRIAEREGQTAEWREIIQEEIRREIGGG